MTEAQFRTYKEHFIANPPKVGPRPPHNRGLIRTYAAANGALCAFDSGITSDSTSCRLELLHDGEDVICRDPRYWKGPPFDRILGTGMGAILYWEEAIGHSIDFDLDILLE